MTRILLDAVGLVSLAVGIVTVPLPLPFGALLIAIGLILLTISEKPVRKWVQGVRTKYDVINKAFVLLERYSPPFIANAIKETNPIKKKLY